MKKYDSLFSKLSHSCEPTSPWWSIIENLRVACEAVADAQEDFENARDGGEFNDDLLGDVDFGRILGKFDTAWSNLYSLKDFVAFTERCTENEVQPKEPPAPVSEEQETVTVDMDDTTLAFIARYAHNKNITINAAVNEILADQLKKEGYDVGSAHSEG